MAKKDFILTYFFDGTVRHQDKQQGDHLFELAVDRLVRTGRVSQRGLRKVLSKYAPLTARYAAASALRTQSERNHKAPRAFGVPVLSIRSSVVKKIASEPEAGIIRQPDFGSAFPDMAIAQMRERLKKYAGHLHTVIFLQEDNAETINLIIALKDPNSGEVEADLYMDADEIAYEMGDAVKIHIQFVPLDLIPRFLPASANATVSGSGQGE